MIWWRNVLYAVFALLAAPLEFHVEWSLAYVRNLAPSFQDAVSAPLEQGALFYYSVILVVETLFRLEVHSDLSNRTAYRLTRLFTYFLIVPFLVFLISDPAQPLGTLGVRWQLYVSAASLILAFGSHLYFSKADALVRQTTAT